MPNNENEINKDQEEKSTDLNVEAVISEMVESALQKAFTKYKEPVERKNFNIVSSEKKEFTFTKSLQDLKEGKRKSIVLKTMTEGSPGGGGYFVIDEAGDEVIRTPQQFGLARSRCTIKEMTRDRMTFPKVSTDLVAYIVGEGNSITGSDLGLSQVILDTHKISSITPISNELIADASYNAANEILWSAGVQIARKEDEQLFRGSGTFTGIFNTVGINTLTASASGVITSSTVKAVIADDLSDMISTVESANTNYIKDAAFFMHPSIKNVVRKLKDSQGQYIFATGNGGFPDTLFGYPVVTTNALIGTSVTAASTKYICFGDLKNVYFGDRMNLDIYVANEGTVGSDSLLQNDLSAIRVIERVDMKVAYPDAFATYQIQ